MRESNSVLKNPIVWCILITETAERVAFFGFRAILVLYFTQGLQFSDSVAVSLFAATAALAYLSPLIGALLADGVWGRYQTILRFGMMYAVGLCFLTMAAYSPSIANQTGIIEKNANNIQDPAESKNPQTSLGMARFLTLVGLLLSCTGTGGIKPCVSAFGADQVAMDEIKGRSRKASGDGFKAHDSGIEDESQEEQNQVSTAREERIREFFNSFYFCINVGAMASFAIIPTVRHRWGFGEAFLIPAAFMWFAIFVFWSQRNRYKHSDPGDSNLVSMFQACGIILKHRIRKNRHVKAISNFLGISSGLHDGHSLVSTRSDDEDEVFSDTTVSNQGLDELRESPIYQDAAQALHVLPILLMFPMFWMLYDQQGSVWTLQAADMALHGLEPEQLNALNPVEIMIFIPVFDLLLYPWLESRGFNIQPIRRMEYGMFLISVSFFVSGLLDGYIQQQPANSVHVAWQIPQITIVTVAEILLSVTGLEFAYAQSPQNSQALILAFYLFMTAIGDGLGAILYASIFSSLSRGAAMLLCALLMLINLAIFSYVASKWKPYVRDTEGDGKATLELGSV